MKLKALRVHGFKSFADDTQIDFHDGITAIVGPNGCGKSNISDAIRWVLGEQRPTAIRGAKMEEAIFQGSVARRPVNRGSVAMVVSNEDGALPVPFEEVEIGRVVYRDGGSDYQLNRATCRLRDVVDLCRDTGLGANAYSVIENRMIDAILSDRADERRSMFEEAAGIGKYKDRRRAALRRLETAEVDLQRLEDVISEVNTKVRSLARQKGKAQRYEELRGRRLAVEVQVVRTDLEDLGQRLSEVRKYLEGDTQTGEGVTAQLRAAEAELEEIKIRHLEAQRARVEVAGRLDEVRTDLAQREKAVAVATERIAYGDRRTAQISEEKAGLRRRTEEVEAEHERLSGEAGARREEVDGLRARLAEREQVTAEVRGRLSEARDAAVALEEQTRGTLKRIAQLEGDHEGAQAQIEELDRRHERLKREIAAGAGTIADLKTQGDLFADRRTGHEQAVEAAEAALAGVRGRLAEVREALEEARARESGAGRALSALEAEQAEVERALRSAAVGAETVEAVVRAFPTLILGRLVDDIEVDPGHARLVDRVLGALAEGLVVKDREAVEQILRWHGNQTDPGPLVLLPLDAVPDGPGALPRGIKAKGPGAPWARALLGELRIDGDATGLPSSSHAAQAGTWVDRHGAIHVVAQHGGEGMLEVKERQSRLSQAVMAAVATLDEAREAVTVLDKERSDLEGRVEGLGGVLLKVRDEARAAEAEALARSDERDRLDRHQEELARQLQGTRAARDRAVERGKQAEAERAALIDREGDLQEALNTARASLSAVDSEWEEARQAESELAIQVARAEHELERITHRLEDLARRRSDAAARLEQLDRERAELEEELAAAAATLKEGQDRIQALFVLRDEVQMTLAARDQALQEASEEVSGAERRVREIRTAEREAVDRRHRLELERQDIENKVARIRERLETEWNRPLEVLLEEADPVEEPADDLRAELSEIIGKLERLGPVNMLAVEEHAEESERLDFLVRQRDDLIEARDDLRSAIRQINHTATGLFMESFHAIRVNFQETFQRLFKGGQADLWLADPESPLESAVEIHASPAGKKTQRIDLLSGGERALTALSLLFGIYLVKPSPFCVLDEVDAPLDESNIGRFIRLLQSFKDQTQFVVITHNPRTIEAADWIYGVTMEEPGVSTIVGVRLQDALETAESAA
ncbi:MAG: chromosome segregation protein SMC [Gemmatimonadota bacterium]|nr:chromosome segregation protein SMC [Gemmatimonadota bacterium]